MTLHKHGGRKARSQNAEQKEAWHSWSIVSERQAGTRETPKAGMRWLPVPRGHCGTQKFSADKGADQIQYREVNMVAVCKSEEIRKTLSDS